jgi:phospholipid-transporting ATPase
MIKDIIEDSGRHKQDNHENNMLITAMNRGETEWSDVASKNLQVGCIVKIPNNMFFPADILILTSSLPKGVCYVETKNLDGETNLKHKQAEKSILRLAQGEEGAMKNFANARIDCEGPNEYLYKFEGTLTFTDGATVPLDPEQLLLRGSALRNTEWIIGVVIYTGHETKIMMNSTKAKAKRSKL